MSIFEASFKLVGHSPLLYGKPVHDEKRDDETHEQREDRTWKGRAHVTHDGKLCIPAMSVHRSLCAAARWLSMKVPGGGQKTFSKRFESGILCNVPNFVVERNGKPLTLDDIDECPLFVPSDGKRGSGKRVWRKFPRVMPTWSICGAVLVTDGAITEDVFLRHLKCAGLHDGLGSMRIGTGGPNGMFEVDGFEMSSYSM
jgi:hypothetical protein